MSRFSPTALFGYFDAYRGAPGSEADTDRRIDWLRTLPFIGFHLACLAVLVVGVSGFAVAAMLVSYGLRIFGITVGYHRYLSHRAFRTGRVMQFVLALCGAAATQRGPLWWAAHHRHHHKFSDTDDDPHSPVAHRFLFSHLGWIFTRGNFRTRSELIRDFARFPELVFIDRFDLVVPVIYGAALFAIGEIAGNLWPALGTDGWQVLVWGYFVSTVLLFHGTFAINSLTHQPWLGRRRYRTRDESRNVGLLSLFTFGESWHNNHHYFPASARLGFFWWEVDLGYYVLRVLEAVGLVWDVKRVPDRYKFPAPEPASA